MDLPLEQLSPEPEKNSFNCNSHNSTTSSISNSHNFSPANFFLFPYVEYEQTEPLAGPSMKPFLEVVSKQLEVIQSQIKVPETETETEDNLSDLDEMSPIPSAPPIFPHPSRSKQRIGVADISPIPRTKTSRPEFSTKRKGKRRRTEDTTLKPPVPEPENDRLLVVDDRTRKEKETTDNFFYFLYFLAFCALIFFLIFLFLLSVLFLFCLYVFHLS